MARDSSSKQKHRHRREQRLEEEQHRRKAREAEDDQNRQYKMAAQRQQRQGGNKKTRTAEYGFEDSLHAIERQETRRETRPRHQDDRRAESQQKRQVEPLSDFMKVYNIEYTETATTRSRYRKVFSSMESLGSQSYAEWKRPENIVAEPIRAKMILRVKKIVQVAKRQILYGSRFSSTTWSTLESNIFENLLYEPVCETCSGRLWTSYVPIITSDNDYNRKGIEHACCCQIEHVGIQLSASFGDHISDKWVESGKPPDRGDRVFGLLPSNTVKWNILRLATDESITPSASRFRETKDVRPGVFPFLISTTNLSEHRDTSQGLTHRAVSAMQRAVLAQCRLSRAAGSAARGILEPLVWCFHYEEVEDSGCAIYAACLRTPGPKERDDPDRPTMRISRLWKGSLVSRDRALQLLLMVDCITEWAKLVHVKNVAQLLNHLVASTGSDDNDPTVEGSGTENDDDLTEEGSGTENDDDPTEEGSGTENDDDDVSSLRIGSSEEPPRQDWRFKRYGGKTYHPNAFKRDKDRKRPSEGTSWFAGLFSSQPSASAWR